MFNLHPLNTALTFCYHFVFLQEMEAVKKKIQEAFREADIDGDGELDRTQLTMLMRKMKNDIIGEDTDPRPAAIDWVMNLADRQGNLQGN